MKLLKSAVLLAMTTMMGGAFASQIGLSAHPFSMQKQVLSTEFTNYMSNGTGMGIEAKYFQRVSEIINFEVGIGVTDGDRSNRIFAAADFMVFPDYGNQPRVSVKGMFETTNFDGERINAFGVAPTVSKGFSFWGNEAFPYAALPIKIGLNSDQNTYETQTAFAAGITAPIAMTGYESLIANFEANIDLNNSYTGFVVGIALPLQ